MSEQDPDMILAEQQRNLVQAFCREFAKDSGYQLPENHSSKESDYEDVTGERLVISEEELTEMESVIYSISFGKNRIEKSITYQAFSAAISNQMHIDLVLSFIARRSRIQEARTHIAAYRINSNGMIEGYDDGNEEGCGEKLLTQLQKMGVENILVICYLWHHQMPGTRSKEIYKNVLERGKDLLQILHSKLIEAENQLSAQSL